MVLGKGLGFVPTPKYNPGELRLDARRVVNKLLYRITDLPDKESDNTDPENIEERFQLPPKLSQPSYFLAPVSNPDPEVNMAINHITTNVNSSSFNKIKKVQSTGCNLSHEEMTGLKWLQTKVDNDEIEICKADKGGAILIMPGNYLSKKVEDKVEDSTKYQKLKKDARPELHDQLIDCWKHGLRENFITKTEAKNIVGITFEGNKSTASRFKYGQTYYVPSLKIHKCKPENLIPGCEIPTRLITCLQEGVTKRSDVYLASKSLKELERDYCSDLVRDTNESLRWLEDIKDHNALQKRKFCPFTFDFESL